MDLWYLWCPPSGLLYANHNAGHKPPLETPEKRLKLFIAVLKLKQIQETKLVTLECFCLIFNWNKLSPESQTGNKTL